MLNDYEQRLFEMDSRMNSRGIPVDIPRIKHFKNIVDREICRMNEFSLNTCDLKLSQNTALYSWVAARIPDITNLQASTIEEVLKRDNIPADIRKILTYRQQVGMASVKKLQPMLDVQTGGRLRNQFMLFGSLTGRWAGRLVQPMNFKKPSHSVDMIEEVASGDYTALLNKYDELIPITGSGMRSTICASKGDVFLSGDYSQIEARLVLWAAGQDDVLKEFSEGKDMYIKMASLIFDIPVDEISEDGIERFCGKQAFLGCGYGIAAEKFKGTCADYGQDITATLADKCVKGYREYCPKVVKFWREVGDAAKRALIQGKTECGPFTFIYKNGYLFNRLPSGRIISYPGMRFGQGRINKTKTGTGLFYLKKTNAGMFETYTYGAKLFENAIQACSFDICAHGMVNLDSSNILPIMNIHDEVLAEVPEFEACRLNEFQQIMETKPRWLDENFPLATKVKLTRRYGK